MWAKIDPDWPVSSGKWLVPHPEEVSMRLTEKRKQQNKEVIWLPIAGEGVFFGKA